MDMTEDHLFDEVSLFEPTINFNPLRSHFLHVHKGLKKYELCDRYLPVTTDNGKMSTCSGRYKWRILIVERLWGQFKLIIYYYVMDKFEGEGDGQPSSWVTATSRQ